MATGSCASLDESVGSSKGVGLTTCFLGPVEIKLGERSILPTASKPRQLLVILATHAGEVVPVPTLLRELWGEQIPKSGMTTLQTYVLQIRRQMTSVLPAGSCPKGVLETKFNGYRLNATDRDSDVARFDRLTKKGHEACAGGDYAEAAALYSTALSIWTGQVYSDTIGGPCLEPESARLTEQKQQVEERLIAAQLSLGRYEVVAPKLCAMSLGNAFSENVVALQMLAFYGAGASTRALKSFHFLRHVLVRELGIEPSARVQRIHQDILLGKQDLRPEHYGLL